MRTVAKMRDFSTFSDIKLQKYLFDTGVKADIIVIIDIE